MKTCCLCRCHQYRIGDIQEASNGSEFGVSNEPDYDPYMTDDPLEAAVACTVCINSHVPALRFRGLATDPPRYVPDPFEWKDSDNKIDRSFGS